MPRMKGAAYIVDFLVREKIPYVFGICGHGNVGLLDALYDVPATRSSWSRRATSRPPGTWPTATSASSTRPVATLTSAGPGSANLMMALAVAQTDSSAFLAITANVPTSQFNRGPFQEINRHNQADFPNVVRPVVKRSFQPTRVEHAAAGAAPGGDDDDQRPARPGQPRHPVQPVPGGSRRRRASRAWNGFNARRSGASPERRRRRPST